MSEDMSTQKHYWDRQATCLRDLINLIVEFIFLMDRMFIECNLNTFHHVSQ